MKDIELSKKNNIEMLLLKIISEEDCYGYQISRLIKELSGNLIVVPEGTMYPTLYKMLEKGYISDYRKKVGKRMERIYYHIEPQGVIRLEELIDAYDKISHAIETILEYKVSELRTEGKIGNG